MLDKNFSRRIDGSGRRVVRPKNVPKRQYTSKDNVHSSAVEKIIPTARPIGKTAGRWKMVAGGLFATLALAIGFIAYQAVVASQKVITLNANSGAPALTGEIDPTKLKGEGDGRINILLLGIGGIGHEAPNLTDTIMVASIDPRKKDVAILSIPRDFYAKIPGYGSTKINAANTYGENPKNPGGGAALAKLTVSEILGVPIHYYVRVDFAAFKQAIDTLGGVEIDVKRPIVDLEFPCDSGKGVCPLNIKAGKQQMNGGQALKYVRSRKGTGGGDFDRATRQQEVLMAIHKKSLQASTLTNPAKIIGLVDVAGKHVSTDFQPAEIKKMAEILSSLDMSKSVTKVLDTSNEGLLQFGNVTGAGSIVIPRAGLYNYSEIREFAHSIFADSYLKDESAKIDIQNGTMKNNLGAAVSQNLKSFKYNVVSTGTAERQDYSKSVIYDFSDGKKPYTLRYLEKRFGVKAQKMPNGASQNPNIDLRVIVGNDYPNTKL